MNRRRMLSSVHRSIARHATSAQVGEDHSTVSRMSIADLDRIGPRLVTSQPTVPEAEKCLYCPAPVPADSMNAPYCSAICAINATEDR